MFFQSLSILDDFLIFLKKHYQLLHNHSLHLLWQFVLKLLLVSLMQKEGLELGDADDKIFSRVNSKQGAGTVGILTNMIIDRAQYYRHALAFALVPFMDHNQWLYTEDGQGLDDGASASSPVEVEN